MGMEGERSRQISHMVHEIDEISAPWYGYPKEDMLVTCQEVCPKVKVLYQEPLTIFKYFSLSPFLSDNLVSLSIDFNGNWDELLGSFSHS